MNALKDKVAVVTGASRGIGRAIAEVFAREGARVVICGRHQETLAQVAAEIGSSMTPLECHVGRPDQVEKLVDTTTREFGRIDVLVNNAGYGLLAVAEATPAEKYRNMFEINFFGLVEMTRAVLPVMRRQRSGHIINLSSKAGFAAGLSDATIRMVAMLPSARRPVISVTSDSERSSIGISTTPSDTVQSIVDDGIATQNGTSLSRAASAFR